MNASVRAPARRGLRHLTAVTGLALAAATSDSSALERVPISDLGSFRIEFAEVVPASERPGEALLVTVDALAGDRLEVRLPFEPNRMTPLVADGVRVAAGDAVAELSGPALGQWLLEAQLLADRYAEAESRYQRNRPLYEQGALSAESWLAISERYRSLRLDMHHAGHVLEMLEPVAGEEPARATLHAPAAGLLLFAERNSAKLEHPLIVEIIAAPSLRLSAWVPAAAADAAGTLSAGSCELPVQREAQRSIDFRRRVWSVPLDGCLEARPGQMLSGRVHYAFDGFRVPRSAVLRHAGETLVAVRRGAALELTPVRLHGGDGESYFLVSDTALAGQAVLVRSNSALQGLLMGLGGGE